ncbi:MAG: endopeptidase La [Candidatus Coatesbacteria bacterium]|nr:endopeptidase La [Candidatus Coatesbacteria bacterium]
MLSSGKSVSNPKEKHVYPLVALRDKVIFTDVLVPLFIGRARSVSAIKSLGDDEDMLVFSMQKDVNDDDPSPEGIHEVGVLAKLKQKIVMSDDSIKVLVVGLRRVAIKRFVQSQPHLVAEVELIEEAEFADSFYSRLLDEVKDKFTYCIQINPRLGNEVARSISRIESPQKLLGAIVQHLSTPSAMQQELLEMRNVRSQLERLLDLLDAQIKTLELDDKLKEDVKKQLEQSQKEYFLHEKMKAIQKELGRDEGGKSEIQALKEQIDSAGMPDETKKKAEQELRKMSMMPPISAEATVSRSYLDWLVSLPWNKATEDNLDIERAERILEEDHFGLKHVKDRVVEYLAVHKLVKKIKGPVLCFVGPPGVGKTSFAQSVARALDRKFVRISLGGVRDEAEIRGHRRTYIGALPGRIIQAMRRAGTKNPVFLLDEVDKMTSDFRGDPASALLEVLDPEQNHTFADHYLDVDFNLSEVMFITTANTQHPIPPALMDRMEIIRLPGYTEFEKIRIAENFLVKKQLKQNGLEDHRVELTAESIKKIIRNYTREAGVRNLEREIGSVCRKLARQVAKDDVVASQDRPMVVTESEVEMMLGVPKYRVTRRDNENQVGCAAGLAWTEFGGQILTTEVLLTEGKGKLILTGQLGDVMQESAKAALSFVRSRAKSLGIAAEEFKTKDVHIHIPEGATPKDGPSAGITMATALASAFSRRPVRCDIAMTGEVTLRGNVLPIGGLKEKAIAAHSALVKKVIIPAENEKDLSELPDAIKEEIEFVTVNTMDEVFSIALLPAAGDELRDEMQRAGFPTALQRSPESRDREIEN